MSFVFLEIVFMNEKGVLVCLSTGAAQYFFISHYSKWFSNQFIFLFAV